MLEYCLELSELTNNLDDMRARMMSVISHNQIALIDRIPKLREGLTRNDMLSVFEAENQVVCDMLVEGDVVRTDLFTVAPGKQGVFTRAEDIFDPKRLRAGIHLREGSCLRAVEERGKVKKVYLRIASSKLEMDGESPAIGVYFVGAYGIAAKVDATGIAEDMPTEVIKAFPAPAPGDYTLG